MMSTGQKPHSSNEKYIIVVADFVTLTETHGSLFFSFTAM